MENSDYAENGSRQIVGGYPILRNVNLRGGMVLCGKIYILILETIIQFTGMSIDIIVLQRMWRPIKIVHFYAISR
jgi:hypothetical protein